MLGVPPVSTSTDRSDVAGTTGGTIPPGARVLLSAAKPEGLNAVYIEYAGRIWFNSGRAISIDPGLRRIGDYRGFPVYARESEVRTIYIPVAQSADALLAPYSAGRR
jgi:hypothetical protein